MRSIAGIGALGVVAVVVAGACGGEKDPCAAEQTPPFLEATTPTAAVLVPEFAGAGYQPATLQAQVRSEDACEDVELALLVDYGFLGPGGDPWRDSRLVDSVPAATMADGPRTIEVAWTPRMQHIDDGCHTVTLLATHEMRRSNPGWYCPADPDAAATITWFVALCQEFAACTPGDCLTELVSAVYCEDVP